VIKQPVNTHHQLFLINHNKCKSHSKKPTKNSKKISPNNSKLLISILKKNQNSKKNNKLKKAVKNTLKTILK